MKFLVKLTDVTKIEADLLAVFAGSEEAKKVDAALGGMLGEVAGFDVQYEHEYSCCYPV